MHILFSLPVHENNDIVRLTIANTQQHVADCTIMLHVSANFQDFDWNIAKLPGVMVNPVRYPTTHGFSQLGIHCTNHSSALAQGCAYDVFCILHTSEMFVRSGLNDVVAQHTYAVWYDRSTMPRNTVWHPMRRALDLRIFDRLVPDHSYYLGSLLEGMWMHRDIMSQIHEWCKTVPGMLEANIPWTLEEVALPTLTNWFGGGIAHGEPYNAFFDKPLETSDVDAVVAGQPVALWATNCWNTSGVPVISDGSTKHSVKRLNRIMDDPVRQHIIRTTGLDLDKVLV